MTWRDFMADSVHDKYSYLPYPTKIDRKLQSFISYWSFHMVSVYLK